MPVTAGKAMDETSTSTPIVQLGLIAVSSGTAKK
jgi:hypothetical protein